jgi:hypothetical protein
MADFAEIGELIARYLGYKEDSFRGIQQKSRGFTNEEAVDGDPVATAIRILMSTQAILKR